MHKNTNIGYQAESVVLNYLIHHQLSLIQANFHSRFGEIDLIMRDVNTLVFIEVKYRHTDLEQAIESISYVKQQKLIKTAQYYLYKIGGEHNCRFDVVVLNAAQKIIWLKNVIIL